MHPAIPGTARVLRAAYDESIDYFAEHCDDCCNHYPED